jgi:hypothetical protein
MVVAMMEAPRSGTRIAAIYCQKELTIMRTAIDESESNSPKAVGPAMRNMTHQKAGPIADHGDEADGTISHVEVDAKKIFEDARADQEDEYIRRGKPE